MRLLRLEIEDFGLIARASLAFASGLTVCSGETGSGKTMLLGALAFVLGERASADDVRTGTPRARVTLEVEADDALRARFEADGFDLDPGEPAIFARDLQSGGKSTARINGRPATSGQVREYATGLLDLVGQHEQQRLLSRAYQLDVLDRFADAGDEGAAVATAHAHAALLERDLAALDADESRSATEHDDARFALREIDDAAPEPGEDDALRERRDYLANVERIAAALTQAHAALAGEEGALEAMGAAAAAVAGVARFGSSLAELAAALDAVQSDATDAAVGIARELDRTEFDASELESVAARLDVLDRLKKKYGGSLESVLAARARFAAAVDAYENRDERRSALERDVAGARAALVEAAGVLGRKRVAAAHALQARVAAELTALAMPAARFSVAFESGGGPIGPRGAETIEFALAPNPGEPARPLARAASGGELSRVLLALVVVLADRRERTTLVFDEIDAGVGGATAVAVGTRLGALARDNQVVCVTHLAQIASWADAHVALRKRVRGEATVVELVDLDDGRAVLEELARMLSGNAAGVALDHARTLDGDVRKRKAAAKSGA